MVLNVSGKPELSSAFEVVNVENMFADLPISRKIADLSLTVILELKHNPLLIALIFGASITRLISILFSTYLILWIQTFVVDVKSTPKDHLEILL